MADPRAQIVGLVTLLPEVAHGLQTASTTGTAEQKDTVFRKPLLGQDRKKVEGKVDASRSVPAMELHIGSNIHHQGTPIQEFPGPFWIKKETHHHPTWPKPR